MTGAAVICDTGALFDYLVASAPDHRAFRIAIDSARARYVPGLVLAEVDYFLRGARQAMRALIADIRARSTSMRRTRRSIWGSSTPASSHSPRSSG